MNDQIITPDSPSHIEIVNLRRQVQQHFKLRSDLAGKTLCAESVYVHVNTWKKWEADEMPPHPAFWELANIKLTQLLNHEEPLYSQWLPRIEELQTRKAPSQEAKAAAQARKEARKAAGF
jgi:hypothetical protein